LNSWVIGVIGQGSDLKVKKSQTLRARVRTNL
jgi:hypothetical protein